MPFGPPPATEGQLQAAILNTARQMGWRGVHHRPAQTSAGRHLTATQGDVGWPDVALAHRDVGRLVLAELKGPRGRLDPEQRLWLDALAAGPAEVYLWRPGDWLDVLRVLQPDYDPTAAGAVEQWRAA